MQPNVLDRLICALSPERGFQRLAYRQALETLGGGEKLAYNAARSGRRGDGWSVASTSANAELTSGITMIRNRARDLVRNNPHAAIVPTKLAAKTWGTGIVPRLRVGKIDDQRRVRDRDIWNRLCDNCDPEGQLDFYGMIHVLVRSMFESGEALIRYRPRPSSWKLPIPLQIEVLEGDYLASSKNEPLTSGGAIIQGIEYDEGGRRVAYHLFKEHPGDVTAFTRRAFETERVPASEIRHVFQRLRPGQARGVSIFAPVVFTLRDMADFRDAELVRKKIASCFAAFVKRPGKVESPLAQSDNVSTDSGNRRIEKFSPGMVQYLGAGEEVEFGSPPAAEGYVDYMRDQLRAVAVGCGITYEMLSGDLTGVNYSSIRVGLIDFWEIVDQIQWLTFIPQICKPTWNRVGQIADAMGSRTASDPWESIWTPPGRRFVDPKNDIEAEREAVRAGLKSLPAAIAATGEDPDEVMVEQRDFNKIVDEFELIFDSDARKVGRASAAQPAAANSSAQPAA